MKKQIYLIRDTITETLSPLFMVANKIAAIREFLRVLVRVPKSCRCDYELVSVGSFDDERLQIVASEPIIEDDGSKHSDEEFEELENEQKK